MGQLIIGDVHGCAAELDALVRQAGQSEVVLVGDLFTKGPDPFGVWQQIQSLKAESVLGNHDAYLVENWGSSKLPPLLQEFCVRAPEARLWLENLPLFLTDSPPRKAGVLVVHAGLHPTLGQMGTTRKMALNLRRFPSESQTAPFWYDAGWRGPETVVFGHDARRGLVRRELDGKPVAIGLDSGCVYGGMLSGWIRSEDRILSVPAARAYRPV